MTLPTIVGGDKSIPQRAFIRAAQLALRLGESRRTRALDLSAVRNFLLLQHHRALGAAVMSAAFPPALRAALPDARIVVGASGFSLDTFARNPAVDRLLAVPDARLDRRGAVAALRQANLFAGEPFVALLPIGTSRIEPRLAAFAVGALCSLGFNFTAGRHNTVYDTRLSRVANDRELIHMLGHAAPLAAALRADPALHTPRLHPAPADFSAVRARLREQGIDPARPFAVFITQTRSYPVRTWPDERFRQVASWLHHTHGMQIVFTGGPQDVPAVEALRAPLTFPTASLAGLTTVLELAALCASADLGLCMDTGPMHVARSVDLPMVILAADTAAGPVQWLPLNQPRQRLGFTVYTPPGTGYPMPGDLSAEAVQQELSTLLPLYPPGTRSATQ